MKKTKHIFTLLLAALLLLAAACNNRQGDSGLVKQTGEPTSAEPATDEPTDIPELTRAPTPEPTSEPTPEQTEESTKEKPSDEWFIEQAWSVAQRIGEIHGLKLAKETARVWGFSDRFVEFRESDTENAKGVCIEFEDNKYNNNFVIDIHGSYFLHYDNYEDMQEKMPEWWEYWREQRIVVTPEDIVTAGCTETEGDEYMQTVARLCGEKMAELLTGAPEGFPARCIKAVAVGSRYVEWTNTSGYAVSMAVIPEDPLGFELFFDFDMTFFEDEAYPELWGWCSYGGLVELEREGDNWVAGVYLDRGEGR